MKFTLPTLWIHGRGAVKQVADVLTSRRVRSVLVVTDQRLVDAGLLIPITEALNAANVAYSVCDEVAAEPTVASFDSLTARLELKRFDAFVAVGGGSVIDTAKGLRAVARGGGSIRDYAGRGKIPEYFEQALIAIPTTAGTGSEISDGAVFLDEERKTKFAVVGHANCPTVALTDPDMTSTMPPFVTAMTGIDALVHAVESYVSKHASMVSEMFAMKAIRLIGANLDRAFRDGEDMQAREAMQIGSTLAMASAYNALLGLCHAIAMPLCALYKLPHGQACGIVLPYVLEYNAVVCPEKTCAMLNELGYHSAGRAVPEKASFERVEGLIRRLGLAVNLRDVGFKDADIADIVEGTCGSFQSSNNPREVTEQAVVAIVKRIT